MLGGADNPNGELPSYITGADSWQLYERGELVDVLWGNWNGLPRQMTMSCRKSPDLRG